MAISLGILSHCDDPPHTHSPPHTHTQTTSQPTVYPLTPRLTQRLMHKCAHASESVCSLVAQLPTATPSLSKMKTLTHSLALFLQQARPSNRTTSTRPMCSCTGSSCPRYHLVEWMWSSLMMRSLPMQSSLMWSSLMQPSLLILSWLMSTLLLHSSLTQTPAAHSQCVPLNISLTVRESLCQCGPPKSQHQSHCLRLGITLPMYPSQHQCHCLVITLLMCPSGPQAPNVSLGCSIWVSQSRCAPSNVSLTFQVST